MQLTGLRLAIDAMHRLFYEFRLSRGTPHIARAVPPQDIGAVSRHELFWRIRDRARTGRGGAASAPRSDWSALDGLLA
ncbi:hypothetical protein EVAR_13450_1 [Eumeta japonica]|uniref:Uncharacterized protein n=1 Tax=Eumeta variegata TaxID=151549 RepID=A0A4C1UXW0_EUMVA|nr:hypothetical protein EVAR_13450_1 [Eumeta japonica]